jgi:DNA-binding LacI/PurR family transcriptional regulator
MGGQAGPVAVDHVSENNSTIGFLAHDYLQNQGCQSLAFLSIVPHKRNAMQRGQAFRSAATQIGQSCRSYIVSEEHCVEALYGSDACVRSTLGALVEALCSNNMPDGLFIDRDCTTSWVYPLLLRLGIKPGADIKIVSCNNDELALSGLSPRPATIDLGIAEIASLIVDRLIARIQSRDEQPICIQNVPRLCVVEEQMEEPHRRKREVMVSALVA